MAVETRQEQVLIVDDEEMVRRALRRRLAKEGLHCVEADSAREALRTLDGSPADLIILDIMMPGRSGRDLLPEIRQSYPDTAVIMATAVTDAAAIIDCMKAGAQDYILKPFDLDEVMLSVNKSLQVRRLQLEIKDYQDCLQHTVEEQKGEIRRLFLGAVESLVIALEAKDRYTAGHSRRVTQLSVAIGEEMNLAGDELEDLRWGALLHDVGKIAVDPAVQNKPSELTSDDYRHIMIHPHVGAGIVQRVANDRIIEVVRHHHDRYDGGGLNQTARGTEIPLGARIVAVADSYDAMTSDRPYRHALSTQEAVAEIGRCSGTQFDPGVVAAFLRVHHGW